jgi:hypothetical protein
MERTITITVREGSLGHPEFDLSDLTGEEALCLLVDAVIRAADELPDETPLSILEGAIETGKATGFK